MILLMHEEVKSRVISSSLNAGSTGQKSFYFFEDLFLFVAPFQGIFTGLNCGLIQWLGNFRETWYADPAESSMPYKFDGSFLSVWLRY